MKKVFVAVILAAGAACAAWKYRESLNRANAAAWAAGTDSLD